MEADEAKNQNAQTTDKDVTVAGWSVERYAQVVKWPAIIVIVLDIIVTTAKWSPTLSWFYLIVLTIFLGVATKNIYHARLANAAGLGFSAGLIVGVVWSVFQFVWYHTITAFFQVITTSLLSVLVGVLMSTSAFLVVAKEHRPSERVKKKNI